MIYARISILAGVFIVSAACLAAQPAPPAPPAPLQEPIPVTPAPAPVAPLPPEPPLLPPDFEQKMADLSANISRMAANAAAGALSNLQAGFFQAGRGIGHGIGSNDDRLYERGQRALDRNQWSEALDDFTQIAGHGGPRADGALYWKAYALNKLGRRDEALAAIADLRKSYAKSRWLDDANALEIEVKQAAGQPVSPDSQPDEELKLLALNALVRSDPQRAIPTLENLLKSSQPPRLKERALFVLMQTNSPEGQQLLTQMARGNGNPDLQLKAIQYLGMMSANQQGGAQTLAEIYSGTNDVEVKRAVINALSMQRNDVRSLIDLARKERDPEMKRELVQRISMSHSKEALDYMMELLK